MSIIVRQSDGMSIKKLANKMMNKHKESFTDFQPIVEKIIKSFQIIQ
jgi:hypothetical protein